MAPSVCAYALQFLIELQLSCQILRFESCNRYLISHIGPKRIPFQFRICIKLQLSLFVYPNILPSSAQLYSVVVQPTRASTFSLRLNFVSSPYCQQQHCCSLSSPSLSTHPPLLVAAQHYTRTHIAYTTPSRIPRVFSLSNSLLAMDMSSRKGFPPPNKSNLYRLLKRFRSTLEHNQLTIRPTQSNNEETLLKVCEKLCHRKKLCVRLLKLSGLCLMPEVMQTLHRYRHLRVYSYREFMKADGSIKQNGGVLNIAFIPPFVISDDAEEQVSIDKNSRLRAGLWKEASRFDWDSRSRILQLLFIMAAFSATLNGWLGSSDCHSPTAAIDIWKRFSDPNFCTASMAPEDPSSPQDIRQGWEIAVKVIKTNVAELYHEKEKPIPPRLRRWGRQTEFAVRIIDIQNRTMAWFGQLVSEMCVITFDRLATRFADLKNFKQTFAVQAELSFRTLMEREVGINLENVAWRNVFSEHQAKDLLSRCHQSATLLKQVSENSSESAPHPHNGRDEGHKRFAKADSDANRNEGEEYKTGEREEVLSPISPDVDVVRIARMIPTAARKRRMQAFAPSKTAEVNDSSTKLHNEAAKDSAGESDTDGSVAISKGHLPPSSNHDEEKNAGLEGNLDRVITDHGTRVQQDSHDPNIADRQNGARSGSAEDMEVDQNDCGKLVGNLPKQLAPTTQERQGLTRMEPVGEQKRFGRYVGTGPEKVQGEGGQVPIPSIPKKAKVLENIYINSGEHNEFSTGWNSEPRRSTLTENEIQNLGKTHSVELAVRSVSKPSPLGGGYNVPDTRKFGKKQFLSSVCSDIGSHQASSAQTGMVSECHRQRIAEKIALQVRREVLLRRQRSDMIERDGRHMVVPPRKRPKYLHQCQ
eukprot:TRINITY_DN2097_c0_g1_i1.p1 TRINITY_DN2097_c0_g1~~TRINITY_DN2097_c0_g1_i1.p1  ORF type:complete len:868 (-),score=109.73 TRINITY_DN2097_c0_g1_i1:4959-7562(-)